MIYYFQNPDLSWNYINNDANIIPSRDGSGGYRSHGTRCAGEIVMRPNNKLCGVGIAYGVSIGGKYLFAYKLLIFFY